MRRRDRARDAGRADAGRRRADARHRRGDLPGARQPTPSAGRGSRFGAGRPGHIHQGQDVSAASGTPIVAPVAGTITWKANQPGGAGIYLVLRGACRRPRLRVFMHLKSGSVLVSADSAVAAGQQLAEVGATGVASGRTSAFEIWVGGWQARGGEPIDPLPQLQRWASG